MLENLHFQLLLATFGCWIGYSSTAIGRPHEGVVRIFGHYEVEEHDRCDRRTGAIQKVFVERPLCSRGGLSYES